IALKLHTKRSTHRSDGDRWRSDMLERLTAARRATRIVERFEEDPQLGTVAPEGHVLPMKTYLSANRDAIEYLITRLGLHDRRYLERDFVAGSMVWCRLEALRPLLDGHLEEWEFEAEGGQLDGTFAHAIERMISLCVLEAGYTVHTAAAVCGEADSGGDAPSQYPYAGPSGL